MASSALHFAIPTSLQTFPSFANFPYDIRHLIWESIIFTPGIHFLKIVELADSADNGPDSAGSTNDGTSSSSQSTLGGSARKHQFTGTLKPMFPITAADKSYYLTMSKTLTRLTLSCNEAKRLVSHIISRPGNLTLDNGRLVLLERSSDIVCISYPNMTYGRGLGKWAKKLDLEQLAKIRRLAIRYSTGWDLQSRTCTTCGRIHSFRGRHSFPRHVYEFAALFKNLETFYFIDCLTVRQRPNGLPCACTGQEHRDSGEHFASGEGGRTYYEADPRFCEINPSVISTLAWVQDNYISFCHKKSKGPSHPEDVEFKVLACEWDADQKLAPVTIQEPTTTTTPIRSNSRQNRTRTSELTSAFQKLTLDKTTGSGSGSGSTHASILPIVFGDGGKSHFDFTFTMRG